MKTIKKSFILSLNDFLNENYSIKELKPLFSVLENLPEPQNFFADRNNNLLNFRRKFCIKLSKNNVDYIKKNINTIDFSFNTIYNIGNFTLQFIPSGKKNINDNVVKYQELCSLLSIENFYKTKNHLKIEELKKVYQEIDEEWYSCFLKQSEIFYEYLNNNKVLNKTYSFYRDDINTLISKKMNSFNIKNKDSWNPADIWAITANTNIAEIVNIDNINEFNQYFVDKFLSKDIIGISLKKISKKDNAKIEEIFPLNNNVKKEYKLNNIMCDLNYEKDSFKNSGALLFCNDNVYGNLRSFNSNGLSNVGLEFQNKKEAARYGKAPRQLISKLTQNKLYTHHDIPKNIIDFSNNINEWKQKCYYLSTNEIINFGKNINKNNIINHIMFLYNNLDVNTIKTKLNVKMQCIDFLYKMMSNKDINSLLTKLIEASKKELNINGPFIKIF